MALVPSSISIATQFSAAKDNADSIIYDKSSRLVLVSWGDAGVLITLKAKDDPKTAAIDAPSNSAESRSTWRRTGPVRSMSI